MSELVFQPARQLAGLLRTRQVSAVELVSAFIAQIERVNPKVNAIVTFLPELALSKARALDRKGLRAAPGPLAGLPI
ncbi:MAG TPA: amidase family protein, partial [Usitatibacter sp.]|nr:amidase family protein [Usitatibacter sp.]